jgi:hypothetical protein
MCVVPASPFRSWRFLSQDPNNANHLRLLVRVKTPNWQILEKKFKHYSQQF